MNIPKAIFFDVDGTLLINGQLLESTKDALWYARDKGVLLFLATGRHKEELKKIEWMPGFTFDGIVSLNGGYCYVDEHVIYKNPVCKEAVRMVVDYITHKNNSACMFCEEQDMYINIVNEEVKAIHAALDLSIPTICNPARAIDADVFQMVTFRNGLGNDFLAKLPNCHLTSWAEGCYDIVPTSTNKWAGILHMINHFGISSDDVAAIGDSQNDIEMLKHAAYSVAMGNGIDEVKEHADYVTGHAENNGILQAIKYLLG